MKQYRKKPVIVEAYRTDKELDIDTLEGVMHASVGDYIIRGVNGEMYPCKPDIFEKTYDEVHHADLPPWQQRFIVEYTELEERHDKLATMLEKYEAGTLEFTPNCPIALLRSQYDGMHQYLSTLKTRARIEHIPID